MSMISLPAHFDGQQIRLDEPYQLKQGDRLIVTVLEEAFREEREDWLALAQQGLAAAYSDDEPAYSLGQIKEPIPSMKEGSVVLASIPQADGRRKVRPVVILRQLPPFSDWLVCGVSTSLHLQVVDFDEVIAPRDVDFVTSGLVTRSLIRLGFLAQLPSKVIAGSIGEISPARHRRLLERLCAYLIGEWSPENPSTNDKD